MSDGERDIEQSDHSKTVTDGRCVKIETPYYKVRSSGDPDDSFDEVLDKAEAAADRAMSDMKEINNENDAGGFQ